MYPRRNMHNLPQQLQKQLSHKQKPFSRFVIACLKCTSGLKHFEKKDEPSSLTILEIIDSKRSIYLNV